MSQKLPRHVGGLESLAWRGFAAHGRGSRKNRIAVLSRDADKEKALDEGLV
ncbi:hypothetical protein [Paraburkholderia sp. ZP32-5]|uniref:hypothetical protein n=1 Tax=Paraburkholderia sp. ZP32-5 TaxID=2883245 RepID=UPI001F2C7EE6|nr:hypothetical protein [Paraburkholderia sp. ZP32-5]